MTKKELLKTTKELQNVVDIIKKCIEVNNYKLANDYLEDLNGLTCLVDEEIEKRVSAKP